MFDFDELEETEEAAAPAVPAWAPVPEHIWKSLPPLTSTNQPTTFKDFKAVVNERDVGEYWGIEFPFTPTMLREMGPQWLTKAMQLAGTLPEDNQITRFLKMDVKAEDVRQEDEENAKWGGAGLKILLQVAYKRPQEDLKEWMFIKMPHEFTGKNERQKNSLNNPMDWNEVTWYNIFGGRFGTLPFRTPRMHFSDMSRRTTNFVNIIEMVEYGRTGKTDVLPGECFPAPEKYKDWALPNNGVDYYYAHARTLAQFFGWHKLNREKTSQVEDLFMHKDHQAFYFQCMSVTASHGPYNSPARCHEFTKSLKDPLIQQHLQNLPGMLKPAGCNGFLDLGQEFILNVAKQAFPAAYVQKSHLDSFFKEAREMTDYVSEMWWYPCCIPEYFSLTHPNAQVDNAWYWRDQEGAVQCGLLDWGGVSHSTIPGCLGNGWMGGEPEVMDEHEEKLVQCFIDEYEKVTGTRLDLDDLYMLVKLAQAVTLYGCCANIGMLLRTIKKEDWKKVTSRKESKINNNFLMRCYFVQIEMFLGMWKKRSPYKSYRRWREQLGLSK